MSVTALCRITVFIAHLDEINPRKKEKKKQKGLFCAANGLIAARACHFFMNDLNAGQEARMDAHGRALCRCPAQHHSHEVHSRKTRGGGQRKLLLNVSFHFQLIVCTWRL